MKTTSEKNHPEGFWVVTVASQNLEEDNHFYSLGAFSTEAAADECIDDFNAARGAAADSIHSQDPRDRFRQLGLAHARKHFVAAMKDKVDIKTVFVVSTTQVSDTSRTLSAETVHFFSFNPSIGLGETKSSGISLKHLDVLLSNPDKAILVDRTGFGVLGIPDDRIIFSDEMEECLYETFITFDVKNIKFLEN